MILATGLTFIVEKKQKKHVLSLKNGWPPNDNNNNNNNNNNDFITVFPLKGGSSSVKLYINIKKQ